MINNIIVFNEFVTLNTLYQIEIVEVGFEALKGNEK